MSIVLIVVAYFVAGWAFRLTIYGSIFCWEFFTLRRTRYRVQPDMNKMFAGGNLRFLGDVQVGLDLPLAEFILGNMD